MPRRLPSCVHRRRSVASRDENTDAALAASLEREINASGLPFQYAVVQALRDGGDSAGTHWEVEATEFPVSCRSRSTHIDLLAWCDRRVLLIGECKRVNPAFGCWVFAKSP